jgi:hypothetical protein
MTEPYPLDVADWPFTTLTAVCHTQGCPADGIPFDGVYFENPEPPLYRGQCGQCAHPITDLRSIDGAAPSRVKT